MSIQVKVNSTKIADTFAEAFPMTACRLIVTAADRNWCQHCALAATGYAASVIGCDTEAGVERFLSEEETPDGRAGVALLFFAFSREGLQKAVVNRVAQCVLTCPTTACYNGIENKEKPIQIGGQLRYFGDGWQMSKVLGTARYWRIPTMDGEFVCEDVFGTLKGIGGGNFLILAQSPEAGLHAAEQAVQAIRQLPNVILPFPGGVVRSGSKVGSRYKSLKASTNEAYCPTLSGIVPSALPESVRAVYEIVIDGLSREDISRAMKVGIQAACLSGVIEISAGNYGGKLGPHHFRLSEILGGGNA